MHLAHQPRPTTTSVTLATLQTLPTHLNLSRTLRHSVARHPWLQLDLPRSKHPPTPQPRLEPHASLHPNRTLETPPNYLITVTPSRLCQLHHRPRGNDGQLQLRPSDRYWIHLQRPTRSHLRDSHSCPLPRRPLDLRPRNSGRRRVSWITQKTGRSQCKD